jgi:hypothetical protein
MRPKGISDLRIMWAIRDITSEILDLKQKAFLFILLSITGNKFVCYYSQPNLAEIMGCSVPSIYRISKSLEDLKFIYVERNPNKGRSKTNRYFINYPLLIACENKIKLIVLEEINNVNLTVLIQEIASNCNVNSIKLTDAYKEEDKQKDKQLKKDKRDQSFFVPESKEQKQAPKPIYTLDNFEPKEAHFTTAKNAALDCVAECARYLEHCKAVDQAPEDNRFIVWMMKHGLKVRRERTAEKPMSGNAMGFLNGGGHGAKCR